LTGLRRDVGDPDGTTELDGAMAATTPGPLTELRRDVGDPDGSTELDGAEGSHDARTVDGATA